jgi:hypothetical protein
VGVHSLNDKRILADRGVDAIGTVTARQLKHCYGWRCNSPEFFGGKVGSPAYRAFIHNCSGRHNPCWELVTVNFEANGHMVTRTDSVILRRFEKLPAGTKVKIRFDPVRPARAHMQYSDQGEIEYYLLLIVGGLALLAVWLKWGGLVVARRDRRGWNGPNYS